MRSFLCFEILFDYCRPSLHINQSGCGCMLHTFNKSLHWGLIETIEKERFQYIIFWMQDFHSLWCKAYVIFCTETHYMMFTTKVNPLNSIGYLIASFWLMQLSIDLYTFFWLNTLSKMISSLHQFTKNICSITTNNHILCQIIRNIYHKKIKCHGK